MKYRKRTACFSFFFCFLLLSFSLSVRSAPGDLDASFGTGGKVTTSFSAANDWIDDIAIQTDGKIVAVGRIGFQPGVDSAFGIARFNSNGTLDTSFGSGGSVTTSFGLHFSWAQAVAIQPDGKIVVCGTTVESSGYGYFAVARYLANGSLDTSFHNDGKVETPIGLYTAGYAVAIGADGKIVVAGATGQEIAVVRYTSDGTPDRRFGYRGRVITSITRFSDQAFALKIQPDGKIVIAGVSVAGAAQQDFVIVRYNTNGRPDASFNGNGIVSTQFGQSSNIAFDIEVQSDGKIVVGGYSEGSATGTGVFALSRYNSNGSLDVFFNGGGKVMTPTGGLDGVVYDIAIQPDGKIIAAGSVRDATPPNYSDCLMIRYNGDGSVDGNFGNAGKVKTIFSTRNNDEIWAMALQNDGRIVVGGFTLDQSDISTDFALARFLAQ